MDHAAFHISKTCKRSGYFNQYKDRFVRNMCAAGFFCAAQDSGQLSEEIFSLR